MRLPHRLATLFVAFLFAALPAFASAIRGLAERGVVTRVEAEPHL